MLANSKLQSSGPRFTIFAVCIDEEISVHLHDGQAHLSEAEFAGEFHNYFGRGKRPLFSQRIKDSAAIIAIVDFDRDPDQAVVTTKILHQMFSGRIATIAVSSSNEPELLLKAMRAGCIEFLPRPFDPIQYSEAIARVQDRFAAMSAENPDNMGTVISLFGAKGGVGTTTLAVYLSLFLVHQHHKKTLLIDHHHQLGHICLYLGVKENPYYFEELMKNVDRLDEKLLAGFLTRHPSGLDLLPSPDMCAARYSATSEEMEAVLEFLRSQYEYIVLDSSLEYQDANSAVFGCSEEVYLVSTPDVVSLRDLSRHVEKLQLNELAAEKLRIAVNRSTSNDAVSSGYVENAVHMPVSVAIPNNYAQLLRAVNVGEPISLEHRSEFRTQIGKWANRVVQAHSASKPEARKPKLFAFWR